MTADKALMPIERIARQILVVRGKRMMLDREPAPLYGVTTGSLNKAVARNLESFPGDFMFKLNRAFVQRLTQHFKDKGDVNRESEIETIVFSSFDNERRIAFFRSLTDKIDTSTFQFAKITDFGICTETSTTLPRELKWMQDTVT